MEGWAVPSDCLLLDVHKPCPNTEETCPRHRGWGSVCPISVPAQLLGDSLSLGTHSPHTVHEIWVQVGPDVRQVLTESVAQVQTL